MKKAMQLISIGLAAYNLYVLVNDFLDTPMGQKVKDKAEPYITQSVEYAKDIAEKVMDKVEQEVPAAVEEVKV